MRDRATVLAGMCASYAYLDCAKFFVFVFGGDGRTDQNWFAITLFTDREAWGAPQRLPWKDSMPEHPLQNKVPAAAMSALLADPVWGLYRRGICFLDFLPMATKRLGPLLVGNEMKVKDKHYCNKIQQEVFLIII